MKSLEQYYNSEIVSNLGPDNLIIHARHMLLSTAKDLRKSSDYQDQQMVDYCIVGAISLQQALSQWEPDAQCIL